MPIFRRGAALSPRRYTRQPAPKNSHNGRQCDDRMCYSAGQYIGSALGRKTSHVQYLRDAFSIADSTDNQHRMASLQKELFGKFSGSSWPIVRRSQLPRTFGDKWYGVLTSCEPQTPVSQIRCQPGRLPPPHHFVKCTDDEQRN